MRNSIKYLFLTACLFVCSASLGAQANTRFTFHVKCGDQGILDAPYSIRVEFKDPSDPIFPTRVFWVEIPNRCDPESICGAIEVRMNEILEYEPDHVSVEEVDEGENGGKPSKEDELKKHCLVVPAAVRDVKIDAFRQGNTGDGGQLEITSERRPN